MEKIQKSVVIDVPPAKAFAYLTDAAHLPEIWPSMVEVKNVIATPDGAHSFDWTYKMAGIHFHGHAETLEVVKDRYRLVGNEKGIQSTFRWTFDAHGGGTKLELEIHYEVPIPVLGRLAAPFLRRLNEREAETLLQNLKERLEMAQPADTAAAAG